MFFFKKNLISIYLSFAGKKKKTCAIVPTRIGFAFITKWTIKVSITNTFSITINSIITYSL